MIWRPMIAYAIAFFIYDAFFRPGVCTRRSKCLLNFILLLGLIGLAKNKFMPTAMRLLFPIPFGYDSLLKCPPSRLAVYA